MKPSTLAIVLIFIFPSSTFAQHLHNDAGLPFIKTFAPRDYGFHPQNWSIATDARGVLYVGNTQGVLEYDGVSWRIIPVANGSIVRSLAWDSLGLMYVGAQGELGFLYPDSVGLLRYHSLVDRLAEGHRTFTDVWTTLSTPVGVFFCSYTHLFRWDGQRMHVWKSARRFRQASWVHQKLFLEDEGTGLLQLVGDSLHPVPGGNRLADTKVYTLLPLDSLVLIGTRELGIFVFNGQTVERFPTEADAFLERNELYCGVRLDDETTALGTKKGGVALIDRKGRITGILDQSSGLSNNVIWGMFVDARGSLWTAMNEGLARIDLRGPLSVFDARSGLTNNTVEAVIRHRDILYAAQGPEVLWRRPGDETKSGQFFNHVKGIRDICWSFLSRRGSLLAASVKGIHEIVDDRASILYAYPSRVLIPSNQDTNRIYVGLSHGVASLYWKERGWTDEGRLAGIEEEVVSMMESSVGDLWLCTRYSGVVRVRFRDARARGIESIERYGEESGLPMKVTPLVSSVGPRVVFATDLGIMRFDETTRRFEYDSTFAPFLADGSRWVFVVREDPSGHVWIESGDDTEIEIGIAELQPDGRFLWNPQPFKGLSDFELYAISFDGDSVAWLGGSDGRLVRFDRRIVEDYAMDTPVLVRRVTTRNDSLLFAGYTAPGAANRSLTLPYRMNSLRFEFAAPFLDHEWKNVYQYRLDGFEESWSDWSAESRAIYTNIPEGRFTFRVRARNIYGWVSAEDTYVFEVLAPWFRAWWAYALYLLLTAGSVFGVVKLRLVRLEREKRRLEGIVKERVREIEEKNRQLAEQAEKLQEMDRIKSRFFANISHEFRTPLTLIMAPIDDLLAQAGPGDSTDGLRTAMRNAKRLLRLINELLDLARLESGRVELRTSRMALLPFLRAIVHSFSSLAETRRIHLQMVEPGDDIELFLDREKAEKIFFNLIANAFKFTPDQGYITVTVQEIATGETDWPEGAAVVSIHDTGIGIPDEHLPFIFDRFSRGGVSDTHRYEGTGIGLALVKELTDLHHGRIRVKSEPGVGTEFDVFLPMGTGHLRPDEMVAQPPEPEAGSLHLDLEAAGLRDTVAGPTTVAAKTPSLPHEDTVVLVVEDNADVRSYICSHLQDQYRMLEAQDGSRGWALASEQLPDLVISDVMMPELDGYQLTARLKSDPLTRHIPVILLTARASEDARIEGLETGADDYITKPFSGRELQARAKNLITTRQALREKYKKEFLLGAIAVNIRSVDEEFLTRLRSIVEKDLSDPDFTVERLRERFAMSQRQFHRKLHALTGQAPVQYLRSMRLNRARQLLQKKAGTVSEIAFDVGFSNLSYFAKSYREQFGVPPSEESA
jgi:signal transduction histidine kinase/DNA-binding response OmpR family regulator/ligand-binding sensor domain-containing protein